MPFFDIEGESFCHERVSPSGIGRSASHSKVAFSGAHPPSAVVKLEIYGNGKGIAVASERYILPGWNTTINGDGLR